MEADGIHPYRAAKEIMNLSTSRNHSDSMTAGSAQRGQIGQRERQRFTGSLNLGYQGHLGVGQGYAMGAQIAHPDKRVVQIAGDGAIGFHIQEWDTMVRHGLPIVTIIFNNAAWGMSIHGQQAVFGEDADVITKAAPFPIRQDSGRL